MTTAGRSLLSNDEQREIVERLRQGSPGAEEDFVRLFAGRLRMMMLTRTRDPQLADDLVQDALLTAIVELRAGRLREPDRLAAFVHGIGRNLVNNFQRRERERPALVPLDTEPLVAPTPQEDEEEKRALAARAIASLNEADRAVLSLTLVENLKPGEIAARLGMGVEAVRARKSRALRKVSAELDRLLRLPARHH